MSNEFYGDEDVTIPLTSNYYKIEEGENIFRFLGSFKEKTVIQGWQYWKTFGDKRRPVRLPKDKTVPVGELEINKFGEVDVPRFFWAFPIYNYKDKKIQIMEINQKTILRDIQKYIANDKWGDPREYDFIITKGKPNEKPLYTLSVNPKEPLDEGITQMYRDTPLDMQALFSNDDPFSTRVNPNDIPDTL